MNVLTKIRLINELNDKELRLGLVGTSSTWHNQYKDSAWIYAGSLPFELSEGDVICVFSQYGEIVNINLIRDKKTGKSKGFAFICYEDQRSTVLAVDNLNGTKIKGRQLRVDHVLSYKVPKEGDDIDDLTLQIHDKGVAPSVMHEYEKRDDPPPEEVMISDSGSEEKVKKKKKKKEKKKKKGLKFLKEKPKDSSSKQSDSHRAESNDESKSDDRSFSKKTKKKEKTREVEKEKHEEDRSRNIYDKEKRRDRYRESDRRPTEHSKHQSRHNRELDNDYYSSDRKRKKYD